MAIHNKSFVREKKIYSGEYLEVDIYSCTENQLRSRRRKRAKKTKVSAPKQKNLNDKNAKRYLIQLVNANFGQGDILSTLTYNNKHLPKTLEEGKKEVAKYLRKLRDERKKQGLPPLKYIVITEYGDGEDGEEIVRMHHHVFMNGGLDRDLIEDKWSKRVKGKYETMGWVNTKRLQPDTSGLTALSTYLLKRPYNKKRWSSSQNLKKPERRDNDTRYKHRQVERLAKNPPDLSYWEKKYKGYTVTDKKYGFSANYNPISGYSITLRLRKIDKEERLE